MRWDPHPYPTLGGRTLTEPALITPQEIDIDALLGSGALPEPALGGLLNAVGPLYPEAWLEALAGCPIMASANSCVSRPIEQPVEAALQAMPLRRALESPWLPVMDELLRRADRLAGGKLAVRQLHLRGVVDVLAATLGEETLCRTVYDFPAELGALAGRVAELYIAIAQRGLALRRQWHGGYVSSWYLYAPGPFIDYQMDASSLMSARMYRQHFLPHDLKVLAAFPYSILHMHACGLHIVDVLPPLPGCTVEVNLDRETGIWQRDLILERCRQIQHKGMGLLIYGELSEAELQEFLAALDPARLAVMAFRPEQAG